MTPFAQSENDNHGRLAEIYREAARLICEKGFDATSMSDIAEAVGITKAGVYHHIPGKKDLLFRIMNFGMDLLEEEVISPARAIADPESRLRMIILNHVRLITGQVTPQGVSPVTIVVDEIAGLEPEHRRQIDQRKRIYVDLVRETLGSLRQEGKLRDIDITVAAFSLLGTILWLSRWFKPDGRLGADAVAEEIIKLATQGLLASPQK